MCENSRALSQPDTAVIIKGTIIADHYTGSRTVSLWLYSSSWALAALSVS
jgi:hypothetical protein